MFDNKKSSEKLFNSFVPAEPEKEIETNGETLKSPAESAHWQLISYLGKKPADPVAMSTAVASAESDWLRL